MITVGLFFRGHSFFRQFKLNVFLVLYRLFLGPILVVGIAFRAVNEERMLRAELPGYEEYMVQVKHRFIPYLRQQWRMEVNQHFCVNLFPL